MISTLLFDLARVILFNRDRDYKGELNKLHRELVGNETYKFSDVFEMDEELLAYIKFLKERYEIYMFTSGTIQEVPEVAEKLTGLFVEIYSAEKLGLRKIDAGAYLKIAELMGKKPEEVLFVDDTAANVEAAKLAGMQGIVYKGKDYLKQELEKVIKNS